MGLRKRSSISLNLSLRTTEEHRVNSVMMEWQRLETYLRTRRFYHFYPMSRIASFRDSSTSIVGRDVTLRNVDLFPLRAAVLCAKCEQIGMRENAGRCLACGSSAVLSLYRALAPWKSSIKPRRRRGPIVLRQNRGSYIGRGRHYRLDDLHDIIPNCVQNQFTDGM